MAKGPESGGEMTLERARKRFGRQVVQLRESRGRNSSNLAGLVGISDSYMGNIEKGSRAVPLLVALKVARALDAEADVAAGLIWLAFVGAGAGPELRAYFRSILPALAAGQCEVMRGPALDLRVEELSDLGGRLGDLLDQVKLLLRERSSQSATMLSTSELARRHLVKLDQIIDCFPGDTGEIRRSAAQRWWRGLHPVERITSGATQYIWHLTNLPDGRSVKRRQRSGGDGRGGTRRGPRGWWTKAPCEIVAGAEAGVRAGRPACDVYLTLSLGRYCSRRAFRRWAANLRMSAGLPSTHDKKEVTDAEVVAALRVELVRRARAGSLRPSLIHEARLVIAALSERKSMAAERGRQPRAQRGRAR